MEAGPVQAQIIDIDPFDLPEWLGTLDVIWHADAGLRTGHVVRGRLGAEGVNDLPCDLLAVDEAYPQPVVDDGSRLRVHQAWRHGQVVIGTLQPATLQPDTLQPDTLQPDTLHPATVPPDAATRMALAVPGTRFDPDLVLDALGRLARAVGAHPERYAALLRLSG